MGSGGGCNLKSVTGGFPALPPLDLDHDQDGEDPFNRGNPRADTGNPAQISGMFGRGREKSTWSAKLRDVTDGVSNTILMGEIRMYCNNWGTNSGETPGYGGAWGWAWPEALWYATTAPINFPTCPDDTGLESSGCRQHSANNYNVSFGFKSKHTGGCHFLLADGSVHFLNQNLDKLTYARLGDRWDGGVIGEY